MAISKGKNSICLDDILNKVSEADILYYYLGITKIPIIINSPLRVDKSPSFGLYSLDGNKIYYTDLANKERGGLFDLLSNIWKCDYSTTLEKIYKDIPKFKLSSSVNAINPKCKITTSEVKNKESELLCKIREWEEHDLKFWESFGISLKWLKYAEVYPISHKIILKQGKKYVFKADKYAYAYVEHKENKVTLKIYQPYNKNGYKWANKHDSSVISLWSKIPEKGDKLCICASLKDALCLWSNVKIPCIAVQGEGYKISNTAIQELKKRYKQIYILFDNDKAGLIDGIKLSELTGFNNIVLPKINEAKDISDLYLSLQDKTKFIQIISSLFNNNN